MSLLEKYSQDPKLKILYDKKINRTLVHNNAVGPTTSLTLRTLDITPSDSNSFFISKTGSDLNAGTQAAPFLTVAKAISSCTSARGNIVILDSGKYEVESQTLPATVAGIYAAIGASPELAVLMTANAHYTTLSSSLITGSDFVLNSAGTFSYEGTILGYSPKNFVLIRAGLDTNGGEYTYHYVIIDGAGSVVAKLSTLDINPKSLLSFGDGNKYICFDDFFLVYYNDSTTNTKYVKYFGWDGNILKTVIVNEIPNLIYSTNAIYHNENFYYSYSKKIYKVDSNFNLLGSISQTATTSAVVFLLSDTAYVTIDNSLYLLNVETMELSPLSLSITGSGVIWQQDNGNIVSFFTKQYAYIYSSSFSYIKSINFGQSFDSFYMLGEEWDYGFIAYSAYYSTFYLYDRNLSLITSVSLSGYKLVFSSGLKFYLVAPNSAGSGIRIDCLTVTALFSGFVPLTDIALNGVSVSPKYPYHCEHIIKSTHNVTAKWCRFSDNRMSGYPELTNSAPAICASAAGVSIAVYNSVFSHCGGGIYNLAGSTIADWCQFYQTSRGYAIDINGFTGSCYLRINHCDISFNWAGVRIKSNTYVGTDLCIIKNSILHRNIGYAVYADNAVPFSFSLYTGQIYNATVGAACVKTNPMYIDDGAISADDTDLNLQRKFIGYYFDSVALGLGDDGLNAGSLNTSLTSDPDTWSTAWLTKQYLDISVVPVSGYINIRQNGSASARKDATYEKLIIRADGIINSELEDLLKIYLQTDNLVVRVYFEPESDPYKYVEYTIDPTNEMKLSPGMYKLSRTGGEGASLTLVRPIEVD